PGGSQHLRVGIETFGAGDHEAAACVCGSLDVGVGDVVAVTHESDAQTGEGAEPFQQCQVIGHDRGGVLQVGQAVDDRYFGVLGQAGDRAVQVGAGHDAGGPAAQVVSHVPDAFPHSQADR